MAKEKNLTAITSVAAADSLRVVTSAGASVKAALSNFPTSGTNTSVTAGSTDEETLHNYIDSLPNTSQMYTKSLYASGYGTRMVIIQKYTNGDYASALEWGYLNTQPIKYHRKVNGTWVVDALPTRAEIDGAYQTHSAPNNSNCNDFTTIGTYYGTFSSNTPLGASTSASGYLIVLPHPQSTNYVKQFFSRFNYDEIYMRTCNNGTWSSWVKVPTRAEVDALNSKTSTFITADNYRSVLATFSTASVVPVFVDQSLITIIYGITGINGTGLCIRHTTSIFDFVFFDTRIRLVRYNSTTDTFSRKHYLDMIAE